MHRLNSPPWYIFKPSLFFLLDSVRNVSNEEIKVIIKNMTDIRSRVSFLKETVKVIEHYSRYGVVAPVNKTFSNS